MHSLVYIVIDRVSYPSSSTWHTVLQRRRFHNQMPVFLRGCFLPYAGSTDVQWSQMRLNGLELGSS